MSQSMYLILVSVQHGPQIQLMFNHDGRAKAAYRALKAEDRGEDVFEIEVSDDYGQTILVNRDEVPLLVLQNLSAVHDGQIEVQLAAARAQAKGQRQVQNDPAMKFMAGGGIPPGVRLG